MSSTPSHWEENPDWVTPDIIRDAFNRGQFRERAERGELKQRTLDFNTHLNRRQRQKLHEPRCTRSQMVRYSTLDGKSVALVHQYRRPDGTLGSSGLPDPKWLFIDGRTLAVRQSYH